MEYNLLRFPHKKIRAGIIKRYMQAAGINCAVCFSCGNAAEALTNEGVDTLHIGPRGSLNPLKWWTQDEITKCFPTDFDATSGHLSVYLMQEIGSAYRDYLGDLNDDIIYVPSGSGETLVCLKLAYPDKNFVAVYNLDDATRYSEEAPLDRLVEILSYEVIK